MKIAVTSQNRREITQYATHPLGGIDVLIAGGIGSGLQARLARNGIEAVVRAEPHSHAHGADHGLDHVPEAGCSCGSGCDCA